MDTSDEEQRQKRIPSCSQLSSGSQTTEDSMGNMAEARDKRFMGTEADPWTNKDTIPDNPTKISRNRRPSTENVNGEHSIIDNSSTRIVDKRSDRRDSVSHYEIPVISVSTQAAWESESSTGLQQVKRLHHIQSLQNGRTGIITTDDSQERLACQSRPPRRIPACTTTPRRQTSSGLSLAGKDVPISDASVWNSPRTEAIYQDYDEGPTTTTRTRDAFILLSRRYLPVGSQQRTGGPTRAHIEGALEQPGVHDEREEVRLDTKARANILRFRTGHEEDGNQTAQGESSKGKERSQETFELSAIDSEEIGSNRRIASVNRNGRISSETSRMANLEISTSRIEQSSEHEEILGMEDDDNGTVEEVRTVVAGRDVDMERAKYVERTRRCHNIYRRKQLRMGLLRGKPRCKIVSRPRSMAEASRDNVDKLERNARRVVCHRQPRYNLAEQDDKGTIKQYHHLRRDKPPRKSKARAFSRISHKASIHLPNKQDKAVRRIYTRKGKCGRRHRQGICLPNNV